MARFVVILSVLVHFGIICSCQTPDIIRGKYDEFRPTDKNIKCPISSDNCNCSREGKNTFIYDSESPPGKCVKDEYINSDDLSDGKFLAEGNECLGVSGNSEIKNLACDKTNASVLWVWRKYRHMLNLRTLKCLELSNETKLILKQCKQFPKNQHWEFLDNDMVRNVATESPTQYKREWLRSSNPSLYYTGKETHRSLYKGCYRFSDGRFMQLVKKSDCGTSSHKSCSLNLTIRAPILDENTTSTCTLDKDNPVRSIDGKNWTKLKDHEGFSVHKKSDEEIILRIQNKSALVEKWPGHLLKLEIKCVNVQQEHHCILLKIEGATKKDSMVIVKTNTQPSTSSNAQSTPYSTPTPSPTTVSLKTTGSASPIVFVIPVVVLFCLLLLAVGIILFYRRRKRSKIKEDSHVYEESNPSSNARTRNSDIPTDYQYAGGNIYSQATYADPNTTISTQPNTQNQEFSYDYATREVTPMIPLILAGDNILDDDTSGSPSQQPAKVLEPNGRADTDGRKGTLDDKPIYHTVENEGDNGGSGEDREGHNGTSNDKPIYHTLENEGDNGGSGEDRKGQNGTSNDKPIYHTLENEGDNGGSGEDREGHKETSNDKPIYHTLENEGDNGGSGEDREGQKGTSNDKPIYHTLENERDNGGSGEDREGHKGTSNDKPIYHTLENDGGSGEDREANKGH